MRRLILLLGVVVSLICFLIGITETKRKTSTKERTHENNAIGSLLYIAR